MQTHGTQGAFPSEERRPEQRPHTELLLLPRALRRARASASSLLQRVQCQGRARSEEGRRRPTEEVTEVGGGERRTCHATRLHLHRTRYASRPPTVLVPLQTNHARSPPASAPRRLCTARRTPGASLSRLTSAHLLKVAPAAVFFFENQIDFTPFRPHFVTVFDRDQVTHGEPSGSRPALAGNGKAVRGGG